MEKEKLWTREFILVTISLFFAALVQYSLLTTLAVFSMRSFGVSEGLAGFTASIAMFGSIIGRLYQGASEKRLGRRRLGLVANILQTIMCVFYFIPMPIGPFFAVRFVHGIMSGTVQNTMSASAMEFIPLSRRAEGINTNSLAYVAAIALGPAFGLSVINQWSYTGLWISVLIYAAIATITFALVRFKPWEKPVQEKQAKPHGKDLFWSIIEKTALPLACMIFLLTLCYTTMIAFMETYTIEIGLTWMASVFFITYSIMVVITRPLGGRIVDKRGENSVMVPAISIYVVSLVLLGLAGIMPVSAAPAMLIAAAILTACGFGVILPTGQATAVKYVDISNVGKTISTYYSFFDIGMGVGAFILGSVASKAGFSNMFLISVVFVVAALIIYWRFHGRHHRTAKNTEAETK